MAKTPSSVLKNKSGLFNFLNKKPITEQSDSEKVSNLNLVLRCTQL